MIRLIPAALALLWGLNWPAVRLGLNEIEPFTLRMIGLTGASLILFLYVKASGRSLVIKRRDWGALVVAGLLNIAVFNIATAFAQLNTSTSRAAILTFTTPMWSVLFAYLVLDERLDRLKAISLAIGAAGLICLALPLVQGQATLPGIVLPLIAAVGWAAGSVVQKAMPVEGDRLVITLYQLMVGAVAVTIGHVVTGEAFPTSLSTTGIIAVAFHMIGATALAYALWFVLLSRMSVGTASLTTLAIPVVGVLGAMALVGDRPSAIDWIGFGCVLAAAAVIQLGGLQIKRK